MLGRDGEGESLAFSDCLGLTLKDGDQNGPVAWCPGVNVAHVTSKDDSLNRRRKPVPAGRDGG